MNASSTTSTPRRGRLIVLEGVDGSGKSTQARLLVEALRSAGREVLLTREPGGTPLGERLRALILDPAVDCAPRAELLMILAVRAQHVAEIIAPALSAGIDVVCDRFSLSSLAYQGYGRGLPLAEIRAADAAATGGTIPDLTVLLDVPLETVLARVGERTDRFEGEGPAFLQRVIDGYRALAVAEATVHCLDGTQPLEAVHQALCALLATPEGD